MLKNTVYIVDDDKVIVDLLDKYLTQCGFKVSTETIGKKAIDTLQNNVFDIVITDLQIDTFNGIDLLKQVKEITPQTEVIVITGYGTVENAVDAMKQGAYHYITKPVMLDELAMIIRKALERQKLKAQVKQLETQITERKQFRNIIATSPAMIKLLSMIERISQSDATVLIEGESGTGKEVIARSIHEAGSRSGNNFVAINCGAMPENILESELFGHVRGAFTGANSMKKGLFEEAHGGTIFLDEIGETSPGFQVKLLRVLQENEIRRVGDTKDISVDARVLAASNTQLRKLVEDGLFRQDLYYRLRVVPVFIPPLRERKEDVLPLARYFFSQRYSNRTGDRRVKISKGAIKKMEAYSWPGNVRELENVIERAMIMIDGNELSSDDIMLENYTQKEQQYNFSEMNLKDMEKLHIEHILQDCHWNQSEASRRLGIGYNTLWRKMKEYRIIRKAHI